MKESVSRNKREKVIDKKKQANEKVKNIRNVKTLLDYAVVLKGQQKRKNKNTEKWKKNSEAVELYVS